MRAFEHGFMPLPRGMRFSVQVIERAAVPEAFRFSNDKVLVLEVQRHGFRQVSLKLDRMRAICRSGVNQLGKETAQSDRQTRL